MDIEAIREGLRLYVDQLNPDERKLLVDLLGGEDEAAESGLDEELALMRILIRRLLKASDDGAADKSSEAIGRLVERLGRVLRVRQALVGDRPDAEAMEWLAAVNDRVLRQGR